ncbi:MAG: Trp biosynthesis-associated membrane protein [Jatrophihabitantaceae bacterium]
MTSPRTNPARIQFGLTLLVNLLGAGGALLVASRTWQSIRTVREHPLVDDVLHVSGRTIDAAPTALALVAMAGVVAVLATRGLPRRLIGVVIALAGAGLIWRAVLDRAAVSAGRARTLVEDKHPQVNTSAGLISHVSVSGAWAILTLAGGVLVLLAGAAITWRGARWAAMSARYEAPVRAPSGDDPEQTRMRADASLWTALDRGDDPT